MYGENPFLCILEFGQVPLGKRLKYITFSQITFVAKCL